MASFVRNICTKNYQNPIIVFHVTVKCQGCFFETQINIVLGPPTEVLFGCSMDFYKPGGLSVNALKH